MGFYQANYEFIKMKEIFKGVPEWEKGMALFHCLTLRDRVTAEHSVEVGYYAAKIAERLGLEPSRYFLAGLLHDIGKIQMDDHPLKTDDVLTKKERKQLKDHVLHGVLTLSELGFKQDIVQFSLRHHERLDGSGYPFGVDNHNTCINGRIAQISDVFSAMTSHRKYRTNSKRFSYEDALALMKEDTKKTNAYDERVLNILEEIVFGDLQENRQYA